MNILPHEKQIFDYEETLIQVKNQNQNNTLWSISEIKKLEKKLQKLKEKVYQNLSSFERIAICRHQNRPHALDFINNLSDESEEIFGDRAYRDDKAIVTFFSKIENQKFVIIGQEKGYDTTSRLSRNFGMPHPEGYRKALRVMKLAEKFSLPIVTLIDTQGAYPGLSAEERGQGFAIAKNLFEMAKIKTPVTVVIIGEGCSGGALGIGVGDKIGMLEHAYYSVISPEGCSSILFKDSSKSEEASRILKLNSEFLKEKNIIDEIIKEPLGGAHLEKNIAYKNVKSFIMDSFESLQNINGSTLVEKRYEKFRNIGEFLK